MRAPAASPCPCDAPEHAELEGEADDVRLVVRNLVANAIQYNRDGGRVDVRIVPATSTPGAAWTLEVADTGIGIPQQDLQRIFERFYRVDVARSRQTGGTGLGLSIVRHAVERHHGTIRVDSLLGEGTTFSVGLPATAPAARLTVAAGALRCRAMVSIPPDLDADRGKTLRAPVILDLLAEEHPDAHIALHYSSTWELLVATVLSAQATDVKVNEVTPRLFAELPGPRPSPRPGSSGSRS